MKCENCKNYEPKSNDKIRLNLEDYNTLYDVNKIIETIMKNGCNRDIFELELSPKLMKNVLGVSLENGTCYGVHFITVDRIEKELIIEAIRKVREKIKRNFHDDSVVKQFSNGFLTDLEKELGLE